jgi:hypothetical protein
MTLKIGEQFSGTPEEPDGMWRSPRRWSKQPFRDGLVTDWRCIDADVGLFSPAFGAERCAAIRTRRWSED